MSSVPDDVQLRADLEKACSRARWACGSALCAAVLAGLVLLTGMEAPGPGKTIRTERVVIVDEQGNPRIVLGAPVSRMDGRIREDSTVGMVVLDREGQDRVSVGSPTIQPAVKGEVLSRGSSGTGLVINDGEGSERAGFGVLDNGRVVLGLDYVGQEAVTLLVLPDQGYSGLSVSGRTGEHSSRIFLGVPLGDSVDGAGRLLLRNRNGVPHSSIGQKHGKPAWLVYDDSGIVELNVLNQIR